MEAVRVSLGLSRPALATENGGLSVRTLENNEGGVNEAKATTLAAYVKAGANANWLLTGDGPMLIKDLRPGPAKVNVPALSAILQGLIAAGLPQESLAAAALEFYQMNIDRGLITPDGIGCGDGKAAA